MTRKSTLLILLTALIAGAMLSYAAGTSAADRRKAEYIFMEAAEASVEGRYDDYLMLLRRAAELDPSDPYIQGAIAEVAILDRTSDSILLENAYKALENRWLAAPGNEINASQFAKVARSMGRFDDLIRVWECLDSLQPSRTDPASNLAMALVARSHATKDTASLDRAIAIYSRLQNGLPGNVNLTNQKIGALALKNDTAAVLAELDRLTREAPADVEAAIYAGAIYHELDRPDEALRSFDRACRIDSTQGAIYLARASFFKQRGDSAAYDREVFRALESADLDFDSKFELLSDYVVNLYTDTTLRARIGHMFDVMQEVNPGEGLLHALYGDYLSAIEDNRGAIEQYNYSIALQPENDKVWKSLIVAYGKENNIEKIEETSLGALERFPKDASFGYFATGAMFQRGDTLGVIDLINRLDMSDTNNNLKSLLLCTKADMYYAIGQADSAFAVYRRAIDLDPDNYMALNNAAYFMAVQGTDLSTADLYSSIAVMAEPRNTTFLDTRAWVFFKKKEYDKARELMDSIFSIMSTPDTVAVDMITDEEITVGDTPEEVLDSEIEEVAEVVAAELLEQEASADIFDHAGDIYFMCGEPDRALEFWKKALEKDPENEKIKIKVKKRAFISD